jgi:DNA-directed RNA polymerase specialized sigma24 family protein
MPEQPDKRRAIMVRLYERGLTLRQIADKMGVSYQAVHQTLTRAGVQFRPRGGNTGAHSRHR